MGELTNLLSANPSGNITLVLVLLYLGYAIRNDAAKTLTSRIAKLERQLRAEILRRLQLETTLRTNGIEIPAWENYPDDPVSPI